ncbi:hypothetical protein HK101_005216, partial [Irineochytrium annulatum]
PSSLSPDRNPASPSPSQSQSHLHSHSRSHSHAVLRALLHHLLSASKSFTPHSVLHALMVASRILSARETSHASTTERLPEALADPVGLMVASVMITEAHLADRQTSCAVWGRFMAASVAEGQIVVRVEGGAGDGVEEHVGGDKGAAIACARLKRMALGWLNYDCHISLEEYVAWLKSLKGEIQAW